MRGLVAFISAFAFGITFSVAAEKPDLTTFLAHIAAEQPSVKWDAKSVVEGDFDGTHRASFAVVGHKDQHVMVAVGRKAADGSVTAQYLEFGISRDQQDAICKLPAHLKVSPLVCSGEEDGEKLPGCTESPGVSALSLDDDECDPINMYWNHSTKRMMWWRN
jgi:hypothetical protein